MDLLKSKGVGDRISKKGPVTILLKKLENSFKGQHSPDLLKIFGISTYLRPIIWESISTNAIKMDFYL